MLSLEFAGWFCCRLSTDPDPSDEPRGVSGWSYALAGEPDLDRLIRFQDAPVVRRPGPDVGVNVRRVVLDGQPLAAHPLLGARVELLDEAKFEGRNGLVSEDGWEPMLPFHLAISGDGLRVSRRDPLGAQERPIWEIEPQLLLRQFLERETRPTPEQVLGAAGSPPPISTSARAARHYAPRSPRPSRRATKWRRWRWTSACARCARSSRAC